MNYGLVGNENIKTCRVSHINEMKWICLRHAQWLLRTYQRSFQINFCGCLDTILLWMFIALLRLQLVPRWKPLSGRQHCATSLPQCLDCNSRDLSHITGKARRQSTKDPRQYIRILHDCGHQTVSRTCSIVIERVGTQQTIRDPNSLQQSLSSSKKGFWSKKDSRSELLLVLPICGSL